MNQNSASRNILVFDGNLLLIAIFASPYTASKATGSSHQAIIKACNGTIVATNNLYWREANREYTYDCDDLGKLSLLEYDALMGEDRQIYRTRSMKKNDIILESNYKKNEQD